LHASTSSIFKAGALYVTGASAITIDSTTAYDCWVVRVTVYASWGEALFLDSSGSVTVPNLCGNARFAECAQFTRMEGRQLTGHSVNSSTMLACGNQDSITGVQSDGNSCQSRNYGIAIFVIGSGSLKYFRSSNKQLSLLSVLMCRGTHAGRNGMLAPEGKISIEFCHVTETSHKRATPFTSNAGDHSMKSIAHCVLDDFLYVRTKRSCSRGC
jgi:hypothetical protein